jgi:hypothetical protein
MNLEGLHGGGGEEAPNLAGTGWGFNSQWHAKI